MPRDTGAVGEVLRRIIVGDRCDGCAAEDADEIAAATADATDGSAETAHAASEFCPLLGTVALKGAWLLRGAGDGDARRRCTWSGDIDDIVATVHCSTLALVAQLAVAVPVATKEVLDVSLLPHVGDLVAIIGEVLKRWPTMDLARVTDWPDARDSRGATCGEPLVICIGDRAVRAVDTVCDLAVREVATATEPGGCCC